MHRTRCERCLRPATGACRAHPWAPVLDLEDPQDAAWFAALSERRREQRLRRGRQWALGAATVLAGLGAHTVLSQVPDLRPSLVVHASILVTGASLGAVLGTASLIRGAAAWLGGPKRRRTRDPEVQSLVRSVRQVTRGGWRGAAEALACYAAMVGVSAMGLLVRADDQALRETLAHGLSSDQQTFVLAQAAFLTLSVVAGLRALRAALRPAADELPLEVDPEEASLLEALPPLLDLERLPRTAEEASGAHATAAARGATAQARRAQPLT